MSGKIVRIGGASGAWGDSPSAIAQLLTAEVDYLMMDYLAEVTMSLLARARMKDPAAGFPPDFVAYLKPHLKEIASRGIKIVANAGGVNPAGCAAALKALVSDLGLSLTVAMVEGDDLMPLLPTLREAGVKDAHSGEKMPERMLTANAYLGALPIRAALEKGADIVVTGRCADSALGLGILMHVFGWRDDQYDLLAAGSLTGHVLECGPQATGGIHTDWADVPGWENIGYPIAECSADGTFVLAKPAGTGGLITPPVVAEQVLYEVGDPSNYMLPDVIADFSGVELEQVGPDRVRVSGARGKPSPTSFKVSATWQDGYRAIAAIFIVGPDAAAKAERTGEALVARSRALFAARGLPDFTSVRIEAVGAESAYGKASKGRATREVMLRLVVQHPDRTALDLMAREVGSIGISFSPGTTGLFGGRPKATPVVRLFTFFVEKADMAAARVTVGDAPAFEVGVPGGQRPDGKTRPAGEVAQAASSEDVEVPLLSIAYARSGDKGDSSNIAIFARRPEFLPVIRREVTVDRLVSHFAGVIEGPGEVFEAPGLHAVNFLLQGALGGGGMASQRLDPQGKAFGQMALEMMVRVPKTWLDQGLVKTS